MDAARISRDFFPFYFRMILLYFLPLCPYAWLDMIFQLNPSLLASESLHFPKTSSLLTYAYLCMYIFEHCCCIHYYFHLPQGSIVYKSLGVCNIRQTIWQTWVSLYSSACSSTWKNYIQKLAKKKPKKIYIDIKCRMGLKNILP